MAAAAIPGAPTPAEVRQNADMMKARIPGTLWSDPKGENLLPAEAPTPS